MTKREVIKRVLADERPPYVPWSYSFTIEAQEKLVRHFGVSDLEPVLHNHLLWMGNAIGFGQNLGNDRVRDAFGVVRDAGKWVFIHSCGDVDELFDDLIGIGLNCFNPFQPEVMDVPALIRQYRSRLTFHGGLSTQRTLPYGTPADVRRETRALIALGRDGSYILSPAHAVEGDVPLENMLAFIEEALAQPGFRAR